MSRDGRPDEGDELTPRPGHDDRPQEHPHPAPGPADREEPPAFGVMLHLLGAVALALASLVWGALLIFGAAESTGLRVLGVFAGLTLAVAWFAWLVRATMGREFDDDDRDVPPTDGHDGGDSGAG